jgi:hypothetical protein
VTTVAATAEGKPPTTAVSAIQTATTSGNLNAAAHKQQRRQKLRIMYATNLCSKIKMIYRHHTVAFTSLKRLYVGDIDAAVVPCLGM